MSPEQISDVINRHGFAVLVAVWFLVQSGIQQKTLTEEMRKQTRLLVRICAQMKMADTEHE